MDDFHQGVMVLFHRFLTFGYDAWLAAIKLMIYELFDRNLDLKCNFTTEDETTLQDKSQTKLLFSLRQ